MVKLEQKKAWLKIVESFMAIMLLLGLVVIMLSNVQEKSKERSILEKTSLEILEEIQTNSTLREEALSLSFLVYSNDSSFSTPLKNFLDERTLPGTNCTLVACGLSDPCEFNQELFEEVYSSEVLIFSDLEDYSPRKLKIFCNTNEV